MTLKNKVFGISYGYLNSKNPAMNLANDLALIKHYIVHTLVDNFAVKFIAGIILSAFAEIY